MASSRSKNARKEEERNANFTAGDTVLGKAEGLPWWPGMIVDEGNVPDRVRDIKPVRKNPPVHVVRWYPKGDFDWVTERNLQLLKPPAIEAYLKRHHGDLDPKLYGIGRKDVRKAYKAASDPGKWLIDRVDKLARRRAKRQHEKEPLEIEGAR
ncbi:hypothetical protein C8F01DRAFT_463682 [Mycena amicta]|nr:hypothetical protein C8F01DRAFT_149673 [Mycena amicta]KAJ7055265.1 hypothetical protein C8F01DRAFT_463682 [Mycena amicta]